MTEKNGSGHQTGSSESLAQALPRLTAEQKAALAAFLRTLSDPDFARAGDP